MEVFVKVWDKVAVEVKTDDSPVTELLFVTFQVYLIPFGTTWPFTLEGIWLKVSPLQISITAVFTTGFGLTVAITINGSPTQFSIFGVIW